MRDRHRSKRARWWVWLCGLVSVVLGVGCERGAPVEGTLRDLLAQRDGLSGVADRVGAKAEALEGIEGSRVVDVVVVEGGSGGVGALEGVGMVDAARLLRGEDVRVAGVYWREVGGEVKGRGCGVLLGERGGAGQGVEGGEGVRLRMDGLALPSLRVQKVLEVLLRGWMASCGDVLGDAGDAGDVGAETWVQTTGGAPYLVAWWPQDRRVFVHPLLLDLLVEGERAEGEREAGELRTAQQNLLFNVRDLDRCTSDAIVYCDECTFTAAQRQCEVPFPEVGPGWSCGDLVREYRENRFDVQIKAAAYCDQEMRTGLRPTADAAQCADEVIAASVACAEQAQEGAASQCLVPFPTADQGLSCWKLLDHINPYDTFSSARSKCLLEITEARPDLDYCLMYGPVNDVSYGGYDTGSACPSLIAPFQPASLGQEDVFHPDGDLVQRNAEYFCETRTTECVKTREAYVLRARFEAVDQCVSDLKFYCQTCGRSNPGQCEPLFAQSTPQQDCQSLLGLQPQDAGLYSYCVARMEGVAQGFTPACLNAGGLCVDERAISKELALKSVETLSARFGPLMQAQSSSRCREQVRACASGQPVDPLPPPPELPPPPPDPACGE